GSGPPLRSRVAAAPASLTHIPKGVFVTDLLKCAMLGAALLLVVDSAPGSAQSGHISGRVHVAGDTTRPVVDVQLALLPGLRTTRSDSSGAFSFARVSPGMYTLRARGVGFEVTT